MNKIILKCLSHLGGNSSHQLKSHRNVLQYRKLSTRVRPNKISYLSVPGENPLVGLTLGQVVDESAEKFGDAEFLYSRHQNIRRSFGEFKLEVDNLAAGFLSIGLNKGDRIGIWGPNSHEWLLTKFAALKAGLILVNINPAYQARELQYCLNKVGIKGIVISDVFKSQNYYEILSSVIPELKTSGPGKLNGTNAPQLSHVISMSSDLLKGSYQFGQVINDGRNASEQEILRKISENVQFDDICNIQFTSGTTGNPKGVMLSHHNILNNAILIGKRFEYTQKDKICLSVPLFHCYGGVAGAIAALYYGVSLGFPSPGFSAIESIKCVAEERSTLIYGTPTMHVLQLEEPKLNSFDLSSLRIALTAGATCPEELIKKMKSKYTVDAVGSLYGLTETSPVFFQNLPEDDDHSRSVTVGYPSEHTEVKLIDLEGNIVPLGVEGEMCARGYMTMLGYYGDPIKTAEVLKPSKWFHTGDLFIMDPTGHARIVGRMKDMIIRGGENIYPKEIEEFLHTHDKIAEAHVFGLPDERMGEEVAVWVKLKDSQKLTDAELRTFCKGKIAHYKIPRYVTFTKEFPVTTSGKVQKFKMRDLAIESLKSSS